MCCRPPCSEIISELEELLAQLRAQRQRYARMVQDTQVSRRHSSVGCFALPRRRGSRGNRGSASMPGGGNGAGTRRGSASFHGGCVRPFRQRWQSTPRITVAGAVGNHGGAAARGGGRAHSDGLSPGERSPGARRASGGGLSTFESPREREPLLLGDVGEPAVAGLSVSGRGGDGGSLQVLLRRFGGSWKKSRRRVNRGGGWLGSSAELTDGGFRAIGEKRLSGRHGGASSHMVAEWGGDIDEVLWRKWFCMSK